MPVSASDLQWRYSVPTAAAGNTLPQTDPAQSFGGFISQTIWPAGNPTSFFGNITGANNRDRTVEYRCIFLVNTNATLTLSGAVIWLPPPLPALSQIAIGVDPAAASLLNSLTAQAATPVDRFTAPASVTFSTPTAAASTVFGQPLGLTLVLTWAATQSGPPNALAIGNIPPGSCRAIWFRRTATSSVSAGSDYLNIQVDGV